MNRYSISDFVDQSRKHERGEHIFEIEDDRILDVLLDGMVWTKMGSMISYRGNMKFSREKVLEHGITKFLKKALTGEGIQLTKAEGHGNLFLADAGKKVTVLQLQNESIFVNGNDILAFEDGIKWDIKLMRRVSGMMAGGLFNIRLEGNGMVAITTHYDPLTLLVTNDQPVYTDPNATVAWSGNLNPEFHADITFRTLLGRGSGETFQMKFQGEGFVVVQPFEEVYFQQKSGSS